MNFSALSSTSLAGMLLRRLLTLIPGSAIVPILQGPLRGKRWIVGSGTHGCWLGSYEFAKQRLFADIIQPGSVIYDLGAHVGFYTLLAAHRTGRSGHVYAFEPLPRNSALLRSHLTLNQLDNVTVYEHALGNCDGWSNFHVGVNPAMGHLASDASFRVQTSALDTLVRDQHITLPDILKIDVEGAEMDVLRGAAETLDACSPILFLATHSLSIHAECVEFLTQCGYQVDLLPGTSAARADELIARKAAL